MTNNSWKPVPKIPFQEIMQFLQIIRNSFTYLPHSQYLIIATWNKLCFEWKESNFWMGQRCWGLEGKTKVFFGNEVFIFFLFVSGVSRYSVSLSSNLPPNCQPFLHWELSLFNSCPQSELSSWLWKQILLWCEKIH